MSNMAVISVIYGILIVVNRLPLVFAPQATTEFYRKLLADDTRTRLMGVLGTLLGLALIISASRSDQPAALIVLAFGCFVIFTTVVLVLGFTSTYKKIAEGFLDLDPAAHRVFCAVLTGEPSWHSLLGGNGDDQRQEEIF